MTAILITGMSGTGKSSVIDYLAGQGYPAVDTDAPRWLVPSPLHDSEWLWNEDALNGLLDTYAESPLFVSGTRENQGGLYHRFRHVVLLTAPIEVMLERIASRTTNPFGAIEWERQKIRDDKEAIEPLLLRSADLVIDTSTTSLNDIAERLVELLPRRS